MITLGTLGPFNNSHDSSCYLTLNWFLLGSLISHNRVLSLKGKFCLEKESLRKFCLEKESFALKKKVLSLESRFYLEKESFALRKKVLSWEKSFVLGKKVCLEKESFALRMKVLS